VWDVVARRPSRLPSGVFGLDRLLDGGFNPGTVSVVIGSSGAGKTLLATQFLRRGLHEGTEGIYITLDEPPEQIVQEALDMGWSDVKEYMDKEQLLFVDASGRQFQEFIHQELSDFCSQWKGSKARIVIDPLTPVLWSTPVKSEQRDLISFLFRQTKTIGTVLCTLEEHGEPRNLSGPDTVIPMYLADAVFHLEVIREPERARREFRVMKCRRTRHSHKVHPYTIVRGPGVVIHDLSQKPSGASAERQIGKLRADDQATVRQLMKLASQEPPPDMPLSDLLAVLVEEFSPDSSPKQEDGGEEQ